MSIRRPIAIAVPLLAAAAFLLVLLVGGSPADGAAKSRTITVGDNFFLKDNGKTNVVTVSRGTKIVYRWVKTEEEHNIRLTRSPKLSAAVKKRLRSTTTAKAGTRFTWRAADLKKGTYGIICEIHGGLMTLTVKVK